MDKKRFKILLPRDFKSENRFGSLLKNWHQNQKDLSMQIFYNFNDKNLEWGFACLPSDVDRAKSLWFSYFQSAEISEITQDANGKVSYLKPKHSDTIQFICDENHFEEIITLLREASDGRHFEVSFDLTPTKKNFSRILKFMISQRSQGLNLRNNWEAVKYDMSPAEYTSLKKDQISKLRQKKEFELTLKVEGVDENSVLKALNVSKTQFNRLIPAIKQSTFKVAIDNLANLVNAPVSNGSSSNSKKLQAPAEMKTPFLADIIGFTNFQSQAKPISIRPDDRKKHVYITGKSGMGKSKLIEAMVGNDIKSGNGCAVIDPHGDLIDNLLKQIPERKVKDVILIDCSDHPKYSVNPISVSKDSEKSLVINNNIEIFMKMFGEKWNARIEHVLRYSLSALLDCDSSTLADLKKLLTDREFRMKVIAQIKTDNVKDFWMHEFAGWNQQFDAEAISPILNLIGQILSNPQSEILVNRQAQELNFREVMDKQKILMIKIPKGQLGKDFASFLGSIMIGKFYQAALNRSDTDDANRRQFFLYIDEFQNFVTESFIDILAESRKYGLSLTISHQYLNQVSSKVRGAIFGNIGTMLTFRSGNDDAASLAPEISDQITETDITGLNEREFYIRTQIDGQSVPAFSGRTADISYLERHHGGLICGLNRSQIQMVDLPARSQTVRFEQPLL